jgi:cytochrome c oxidase subunit 1/cytochrome c oxidase subunit I+III
MPRRIYTYGAGMGFSTINLIVSLGAYLFAFGVALFFWNVFKSWRHGAPAGPDPWGGPTLEWATESPPPPYNFAVIPTLASRHPLWEEQLEESEHRSSIEEGMTLEEGKEALAVSILDGEPERILKMPEDTTAPFWLTVATTVLFGGLLFREWWIVAIGGVGAIAALIEWNRPRRNLLERETVPHREPATEGADG